MNIISSLFQELKHRSELQAIIPMGYTPGIPMLSVKQDNLCLIVPFLRYKITGEKDKTLVFPIRFVAEYLIPEGVMVKFEDLAYTPLAENVDFSKACGLFRHKAIENLSKQEYESLRTKTLESLDKIAEVLLGGAIYSKMEHELLCSQLQTIVEPSLWSFYQLLAPEFYNKYFTNGKD
ncbi:MAG: hypothetical protein LUD00_04090 [Prevotellaceae bacterium]|nr:hypothetical protein [Prevotellaceae bacterium]